MLGHPESHPTPFCSSNIHIHTKAPPGTQLPADCKVSTKVSRDLCLLVWITNHRFIMFPVSPAPPMIYPCIPYSHREQRLFWRRCCQAAMEAPTPSCPKSLGMQLPWGTSPCRHGSSSPPHYRTFRSSVQGCRGRRAAVLQGSGHLHLCKQSLPLESNLVPPPSSCFQLLILGQHSQQHPDHWRSLGCGLGKLNPGSQTRVTWKSRTERLFHHPLGFEERAHLSLPRDPTISCHCCHFCSSPANKKPN